MATYGNRRPQGYYGNDRFGLKQDGDDVSYDRRGYEGRNDAFYVRRYGAPLFGQRNPNPYPNNRNQNFKGGTSPTAHK